MSFSQCPDEFQIEQHFNQIGHKTTYSGFNVEQLDSKYKFTYPYQQPVQMECESDRKQLEEQNQNQRIIHVKKAPVQNEQAKIRTIHDFKIDKAWIKPVKKKKLPQPVNNIRIPIKILPMNCKYLPKPDIKDDTQSQNKSVFEISFHQEPKINKFHELLNKTTLEEELQETRTIAWYGKYELCEGTLNGRVIQYFKTPIINVII